MAEVRSWASTRTEGVRHEGPVDDLEPAMLSWVRWFTTARLHSALDYATPLEFENAFYRLFNAEQQPLSGEPALH